MTELWQRYCSGDESALPEYEELHAVYWARVSRVLEKISKKPKLTQEQREAANPWELPFHEYRLRSDACKIGRMCAINVDLDTETPETLARLSTNEVKGLAQLIGGRRSGSKDDVIAEVFRVHRLIARLSAESIESLESLTGKELLALCRECRLYKGGNKHTKAVSLINWATGKKHTADGLVARANHQQWVRYALARGLSIYNGWENGYPSLAKRYQPTDLILEMAG